jgi:adenylate cyclase
VAKEIERKFLLHELPSLAEGIEWVPIEQGYLAIDATTEVRVRRAGEERFITVKGGHGEVRDEIEIPIGDEQLKSLWQLTQGRRLTKRRLLIPLDEVHEIELDVFLGELDGLLIAEIEFESEVESLDFEPPDWLGEEITGDDRYAGQRLALDGAPEV